LKAGGGTASAGAAIGRTRTVLVVAEVALAMVLLVSAGLMLESFAKLLATDRGFRADEVITANLDYSVSGFGTWVEATRLRPQVSLQQILERLRQLPGVRSAGAAYGFPVLRRENQPPTNTLTISGRPQGPADAMPTAFTTAISPGYLSALGIRVLRGRDFSESDTLDARGVALINETFARRYFPGEDPIGHYLTPGRAARPLDTTDHFGIPVWSEIVGVVSDVKSLTVQPEAAPEIYRPYWQWPMQSPILFVRTTGDPAQLASAIRSVTKQIVPSLPPPEIRLMTERVSESVAQSRFQTELLNLLGAVALLLATVGIYGVLAFGVTQRRRELGIRFALGARRRDVVALVVGQGIRLTILGIAVGTTAAVVLTRALRSQLYEVQPADPATFGAVVVLLLVVALMAAWLPARRATRVDPMVSLRAE
jgi:putative ABC transport system permease protein